MALPLPVGLVPSEVAFLCEMELVTVVPRQRLESIDLLGVRICPRARVKRVAATSTPETKEKKDRG